MTTRKFHFHSI